MQFRFAAVVAVLVSVLVAVPARAQTSGGSAADATQRQYRYLSLGQFGRLWDEMHPAQQALVSRELYVTCALAIPPVTFERVTVLEEYEEEMIIPGTEELWPVMAVTVEISARSGLLRDTWTRTDFLVWDGEGWRWLLRRADSVAAFQAGRCPS